MIVLYTQRVEVVAAYGERRDCADQRIPAFLSYCGFLPIPVPNQQETQALAHGSSTAQAPGGAYLRDLVETLRPAGIVLTGGNSLARYGGNAPERDRTDRALILLALERGLPLYGFCRGMQSILDHFGNPLSQVTGHVAVRHRLTPVRPGASAELAALATREVNSYHEQACLALTNDELEAVLRSEDGVIEMVRHRTKPIVGTMWHPEREEPFREEDAALLRQLMKGRWP